MANNDTLIDGFCNAFKQAGVNLIVQLPCDRLSPLLNVLSTKFPDIPLTREEEGVGIAAGAVLAGAKPIMIVQSSGLGNMVNALLSLTKFYKFSLPIFISHRGIYKEKVSAQIPMGSRLPSILDAMGIEHESYSELSDLKNLEEDLLDIFNENKIKCFLLSPKLFEGSPRGINLKASNDHFDWVHKNDRSVASNIEQLSNISEPENRQTRYEALSGLKDHLRNKAIICNMGFPSRELYSIFDQASNFYMLGSLGLASSIGLGVAIFTSKQVVVIDGDGSILMNPNTMFLIGAIQPQNLSILCLDNGTYGSTGDQPTLSSFGIKLDQLAKACNFQRVVVSDDPKNISAHLGIGTNFIRLLIKPGNAKVGTIDLNQHDIKERFMSWLHE